MKKLVSLLLAALLALTCLPAALAETELEPVTLRFYYPGTEKEGSKDVEAAFNKKLAEVLPNTTLEIVWVGSYAENLRLFFAGEEPMDIIWEGWYTPIRQDVEDGNILRQSVVDADGAGHGALAGQLRALNVDALICGGIGEGARMALAQLGVELHAGVAGAADDAVQALLAGTLTASANATCDHHGHEHHGEHHCHEHHGEHHCHGHHGCAGNHGR